MHLTNQFRFKCSHVNFSSEKLSVYFHNKNSRTTVSKSIDRLHWVSALPAQSFFFSVAPLHDSGLIHTFISSQRESVPSEKESSNNAYLPASVFRIGNKYRDQLLAYFCPLVIITYHCFLQKGDWIPGTSESGCPFCPPTLATCSPRYPLPSRGPFTSS